MLAQVFVQ